MSLISSNTFIEPVAGAAINTGRQQTNNSLKTLLSNFKSSARPVGVNITMSGNPVGPQEGMLFRDDSKKAFYVYDTTNDKSGTGWTRNGIGLRIEEGEAGLKSNAETYEIGELVATVSANPSISSAARLYLCTSNSTSTGTLNGFLDVGNPQYYSVDGSSNVVINSSRTSVYDLKSLGEVIINSSFSGSDCALSINSDTGLAGHALYSRAYNGPAITADAQDIEAGPSAAIESIVGAANNYYLWCSYNTNANFVGGIRADSTTSVQFVTSSDYRLKENIEILENSSERLKQLKAYSYNFKQNSAQHEGMLAHEVQSIVPSAVVGVKDEINEEGKPVYQSMDYSRLVPLLVSSLQESIERIEKLEAELSKFIQ